jgi:hypothetical protein
MDSERLYQMLEDSTEVFRKGKEVQVRKSGGVKAMEVFGYPHINEAPSGDEYERVDMIFIDVLVDKKKATGYAEDLKDILSEYPQPERLAGGPCYIELAPACGLEQEGALRLMALGKTLGLWEIMSGKIAGMDDEQTLELARSGFLMISGYKPPAADG